MNFEIARTSILKESEDMMTRQKESRTGFLKKVVTPSSLIIIDQDVITTYINADTEFNDEAANENIDLIWNLIKGKRYFNLVVPDPSAHITVDAGNYVHDSFDSLKKAEALVIKTLGHRILAQVYIRLRSHRFPVRVFGSEMDARKWFDSLRRSE